MDQYELNKSILCYTSVADKMNHNIIGAQKDLLHLHQKICLNIQDLQHLLKPHNVRDQEVNIITKRPPNITTKYKSTADFSFDQYPMFLACILDTAKSKYTDVVTNKPIAVNE